MTIPEQLAAIITALEEAGWQRRAGNTWCLNTWTLTTGYVHGEATIKLTKAAATTTGKGYRSRGQGYGYRGAEPLAWFLSEAVKVPKKKVGKPA